jgi:hypothetical protein
MYTVFYKPRILGSSHFPNATGMLAGMAYQAFPWFNLGTIWQYAFLT